MAASEADRMLLEVARTVRDERVLRAMRAVPRERFVPPRVRDLAYEDTALEIGEGQTISQPTIVAMMSAALRLAGDEHVLEVGTGSGYQAAVLAHLARDVVSVEVVDSLRESATATLADLGVDNVSVRPAGEALGHPPEAPYDAIVVTAAAPSIPPPLVEQLRPGGRLVVPVGSRSQQELIAFTRGGGEDGRPDAIERLGPCRFVPLVGPHGFSAGLPDR